MKRLLSAAALVVTTAGLVMAQQKASWIWSYDDQIRSASIALVVIEAVQKDLGFGEDVARKLTLLRDDYRAAVQREYESAGINPQSSKRTTEQAQKMGEIRAKVNNEFNPKALELLAADQIKRLYQIQLQVRLKSDPTAFLTPDVASELNLTNDQKQSLSALSREMRATPIAGGNSDGLGVSGRLAKAQEEYAAKAVEILTAEQKAALSKLKGNEFDISKLAPPAPQRRKGN